MIRRWPLQQCVLSEATPEVLVIGRVNIRNECISAKLEVVHHHDVRNGLSLVKLNLFKIQGKAKIFRDTLTLHERLLFFGEAGSQYHYEWVWGLGSLGGSVS